MIKGKQKKGRPRFCLIHQIKAMTGHPSFFITLPKISISSIVSLKTQAANHDRTEPINYFPSYPDYDIITICYNECVFYFSPVQNPCENSPCLNNGVCSPLDGTSCTEFQCACDACFTGERCEQCKYMSVVEQ